jgi:repressor LexA
MLTRKQYELLMFIEQHLRTTGISPSFDEMRIALELRSKSGIHRLISSLEERGFIARRPNRARALEVIKMPGGQRLAVNQPAPEEQPPPSFTPNVIRGDFSARLQGVKAAREVGSVELPLYGRIAAGLPIEAIRNEGLAQVEVPVALLGGGEHFALEVAGDSMVEAGILDGDIVVIRRGEAAENGQIVVALVDESEVTLKRLRKRGYSVALEPANARYEPQIFPAERVRLQGTMVALLRRYA